jgi:hypothetical protein
MDGLANSSVPVSLQLLSPLNVDGFKPRHGARKPSLVNNKGTAIGIYIRRALSLDLRLLGTSSICHISSLIQ